MASSTKVDSNGEFGEEYFSAVREKAKSFYRERTDTIDTNFRTDVSSVENAKRTKGSS